MSNRCDLCNRITKRRVDLQRTYKAQKAIADKTFREWKKYNDKFKNMACSDCYGVAKKAVKGIVEAKKSHKFSGSKVDEREDCRNCVNAAKLVSDLNRTEAWKQKMFRTEKAKQKFKKARKECQKCYEDCGGAGGKIVKCKNYENASNGILEFLINILELKD